MSLLKSVKVLQIGPDILLVFKVLFAVLHFKNMFKYKNICFPKQRYFKNHGVYVFSSISGMHYNIFIFLTSRIQRFDFNKIFHGLVSESQEHTVILTSTDTNKTHSTMHDNVSHLVEFGKCSAREFWYEIAIPCESTLRHTTEYCSDIASHFKSA